MITVPCEKQRTGDLKKPAREDREALLLKRFIEVFCKGHHSIEGKDSVEGTALCAECGDLLDYALERLRLCPYEPKPKCKACVTHCYKPAYRARIKEVMRYSGIHFVKRGRLDWLVRYFFV